MRAFSQRFGKRLTGVTTGAERMLVEAPWEGKVRQLKNVIERGCMLAEGEFVSERDLAGAFQASPPRSPARPAPRRDATLPLQAIEREHIIKTLEVCLREFQSKGSGTLVTALGEEVRVGS